MTRAREQGGFTLLEVLIAIAVLAMISALVWYSFYQTFKTIDLVRADADMLRQARQVTSRVPNELAAAFIPSIQSPTANVKYEFVAEDGTSGDRVRFDTLAHARLYRDVNESDQSEIEYFLENYGKEGLFRLMRREDPVIDDQPEEGGATLIMAEKVKAFELSWFDHQKDQWVDEWNTTRPEHANRLPYAVRMKLTLVDTDGFDRTWITSTTIRLAKPQEPR